MIPRIFPVVLVLVLGLVSASCDPSCGSHSTTIPSSSGASASPSPAGSGGGSSGFEPTSDAEAPVETPDAEPDVRTLPLGCDDPDWQAGACVEGTTFFRSFDREADHVDDDPINNWADLPPLAGDHRSDWAKWGAYSELPAEYWVHNLERGGAVFLYNPCLDQDTVLRLAAFARAREADDGGDFRWILAPYPRLDSAIAVITWENRYSAECVTTEEIEAFLVEHYRNAPQDEPDDGGFSEGWLAR